MDARSSSTEVRWRDLKYIQREAEDKDQFARNWELAFGKKEKAREEKETSETTKEILDANNESKD
jgi:hypothetical protein